MQFRGEVYSILLAADPDRRQFDSNLDADCLNAFLDGDGKDARLLPANHADVVITLHVGPFDVSTSVCPVSTRNDGSRLE